MKTLTAILTIVFLTLTLSSQNNWVSTYNSSGSQLDWGYDVCFDNQGNVFSTGVSGNAGNLQKFSPTGSLVWSRFFNGYNNNGPAVGYKVLADTYGNVFVFAEGRGLTNNDKDFILFKFDANGNQIFSVRFGNPNYYEIFADATFDNNMNIVVALASVTSASGDYDMVLLRFNPSSGVITNYVSYNSGLGWHEIPVKIIVSQIYIYVVGNRATNTGHKNIFAIAYDYQFNHVNSYLFNGNPNFENYATSACFSPYNRLLISGSTDNANDPLFTVIGLTETLNEEWVTSANIAQNVDESAMDIQAQGGSIVACGNANDNVAVVKLNTSGVIQWTRTYDRGGFDRCSKIRMNYTGGIYVSGFSTGSFSQKDAMILKYDLSGNLQFQYNYNGSAFNDDMFNGLAENSNNQIFAAGYTSNYVNNTLNYDVLVISLDGNFTGLSNTNQNIPEDFSLEQNFPNPFNPSTTIRFSLPSNSNVKLAVYNIAGQEVASLVNEEMNAGTYEYKFDASKLSSGVYFYKLITNSFTDTKKMILVK